MVTLHKDKPTYGSSRDGYSVWKALPNGKTPIYIGGLSNFKRLMLLNIQISIPYDCDANTYNEKDAVEITKSKFISIYRECLKDMRNAVKVE
jgi:hypothetical protein